MTASDRGTDGEHEDGDAVDEPHGDPSSEELDALAYDAVARNGSLVPRSLLDFLR